MIKNIFAAIIQVELNDIWWLTILPILRAK